MRNRGILFVLFPLILGGCEGTAFQVQYGWNEERALAYTWMTPRPITPEPAYCYRTLAEPDCFRRPQPRQATRLVGYIGPEPL
jgi:hypothetical protein